MSDTTMLYATATVGGLTLTILATFCLVCVINGLGNTVGLLSLWLRRREKAINLHRERAAADHHSRVAREYEAGPALWSEGNGEA